LGAATKTPSVFVAYVPSWSVGVGEIVSLLPPAKYV
jgi:hypothetical protein